MTKEPYRSREEEKKIVGMHGAIWRGLEGAHHAIVYGLSRSPLDAELGQTLAAGWSNNNLEQISVICPDHALLAQRMNLLLDPRREVKVSGFLPGALGAPVDYTIRRETVER